jgi:hypothetical protein
MRTPRAGALNGGSESHASAMPRSPPGGCLDHAYEVIPDIWKIKDSARLNADVMDLRYLPVIDTTLTISRLRVGPSRPR